MQIVFFTHPAFQGSQSMPRFAKMLVDGMQSYGHKTEVWTPEAFFYNLPVPGSIRKWFGYLDQYFLFPIKVRKRLKDYEPSTLFVFTDHALGPWIPLVKDRPHVIHCHDFLAQRSALGEIQENPTSKTGKVYQNFIKRGYQQGKNFISVSDKTRKDLHMFLGFVPSLSEVVYNGINKYFNTNVNKNDAKCTVLASISKSTSNGYLLHVGGNQWYKNRPGVIEIYDAWRNVSKVDLPLIMIGAQPDAKLMERYSKSTYQNDIYFLTAKKDDFVRQAYHGATVLIFPSLAEGFGWPIAEAMACGCPVITTNEAPMTEVGGNAAFYIPRMPNNEKEKTIWAQEAGLVLNHVVEFTDSDCQQNATKGYNNIQKFDLGKSLARLEEIYKSIVYANGL